MTSRREENFSSPTWGDGLGFLPVGVNPDHLEWDFDQALPDVITGILHSCLRKKKGGSFTIDEIMDWSINRRLQGFLAVVSASRGNELSLKVHCSNRDCGEMLDIGLDLNAFSTFDEVFFVKVTPESGTELTLRFPTGRDQALWIEAAEFPSASQMARDLVVKVNDKDPSLNDPFPDEWLEAIGDTLDKEDPFTNARVNTKCPQCEFKFSVDLELEEILLKSIYENWRQLLDEVHHLAIHYHWTESDIFAVPLQRRRYYLDRILEAGRV